MRLSIRSLLLVFFIALAGVAAVVSGARASASPAPLQDPDFVPSEQIPAGADVSFPVDI